MKDQVWPHSGVMVTHNVHMTPPTRDAVEPCVAAAARDHGAHAFTLIPQEFNMNPKPSRRDVEMGKP
eukprot:1338276-Amphidinium_carterae.1